MAVFEPDPKNREEFENKQRGGTHMRNVTVIFLLVFGLAATANAQEVHQVTEAPLYKLVDIFVLDESQKTLSRFDFFLGMEVPGSTLEVGEEVIFTFYNTNGLPSAVVFKYQLTGSNGSILIPETTVQQNSVTVKYTPTEAMEYQFRVRGEEYTTFSGTEAYRTKLLVFRVGDAPANTPPVGEDFTLEVVKGVQKCFFLADYASDAETPDSGLLFNIISSPVGWNITHAQNASLVCVTAPVGTNQGSYSLVWKVSDGIDFSGPYTGTLVVLESEGGNTAPAITLKGANPLYLTTCHASFQDPGATAWDAEEGDISGRIQITGSVNTAVPGTYPVVYTVADLQGSTASVTRQVIVTSGGNCGGGGQDPEWRDPNQTSTPTDVCLGAQYVWTLDVYDPDGGSVSLQFEPDGKPSWLSLSGMTVSGTAPTVAGVHPVKLRATDDEGSSILLVWNISVRNCSTTSLEDEELPKALLLHGNYPNPFNPSTSITYEVSVPITVYLRVVDVVGRVVLMSEQYAQAGHNQFHVDASLLPSGVYFYQLTAGEEAAQGRMVLQK